jgi:para-nitrobenzyl esterase
MTSTIAIDCGALVAPEPSPRGIRVYKGIPYAAPPVGPLRWRPPQPVSPWTGARKTDTFGPNSLQGIVFNDIDPYTCGVSEDCLYLNVWTPASPRSTSRLPVMMWIHGGGFVVGSGSEPRYDGSRLARRGIVVVTLNHRLNALGFLAHPELTRESDTGASGAYGMLDLVAALQWVKRNIEAFGGDPDAVTLAGESAGSHAVSALMASPLARGLFARAIGESGAMFATPTRSPAPLTVAESQGLAFTQKVGARTLAELREAPADAILAAAPGLGAMPIVDGHFLPRSPAEIFAAGQQADVPLMAGWNKDEGFNFNILNDGSGRAFKEIAKDIFGRRLEKALAFYPARSEDEVAASARRLGGDMFIVHPTWAWLEAQKKTGSADIFRFRFDRAPLTPEGWFGPRPSADAGAFHAGELLYVFDNLDAFPWLVTDDDVRIAKLVSSYWLNFVKSGDPNGAGLPQWPGYREPNALLLSIDATPGPQKDDGRPRHEFLASLV